MQREMVFLRRRHKSLGKVVENLEQNLIAFEESECNAFDFDDIFDRIDEVLSEVRAIRVSIVQRMNELEMESEL